MPGKWYENPELIKNIEHALRNSSIISITIELDNENNVRFVVREVLESGYTKVRFYTNIHQLLDLEYFDVP
jgi:hypothetical protein